MDTHSGTCAFYGCRVERNKISVSNKMVNEKEEKKNKR
ncbi:hypothetical protein [Plasmodium yoelii yoelii]|uniref:Uncharacterized protein n=1 Tax=Plasmodium yoelii yoelii TaxID=73239 RepID=Q7RQG5_PLAYO|nr:hypothetical protein [Plasmodium yoelii yoelii]